MRTLLLPTSGAPFFGEDRLSENIRQPFVRFPPRMLNSMHADPYAMPVDYQRYVFACFISSKNGEAVVAVYEQVS